MVVKKNEKKIFFSIVHLHFHVEAQNFLIYERLAMINNLLVNLIWMSYALPENHEKEREREHGKVRREQERVSQVYNSKLNLAQCWLCWLSTLDNKWISQIFFCKYSLDNLLSILFFVFFGVIFIFCTILFICLFVVFAIWFSVVNIVVTYHCSKQLTVSADAMFYGCSQSCNE